MRSLLGIRRGALALVATTIAVGGLSLVNMPAAHAAALTPTCDAFGVDANGNPTQPPLAQGNTLPPLDLPSLGSGVTHIPTGLTFPVNTPSGTPVALPDEATVKIAGNPVTVDVNEIKNIALHFKIEGAAAVSAATVSGGNVLGATAATSKTSLTLVLPGKQNGSTMPKGNAFFPGGSSFTPPAIGLTVTAPNTPGTISTSLVGMDLMVQVVLGATKINTFLDCTFPTNTLGSVSVVQPGAPVAVDDHAETAPGKAVVIDVLANDEPNDDGMPPDPSTLTIIANPKHGAADVTPDHTIEYTPANGFNGASDTFQYQVCVANEAATTSTTIQIDEDIAAAADSTLKCDPANVAVTVSAVQAQATTTIPAPTTIATELPRTGTSSTPVVMLGAGLCVVGLATFGATRRRRRA